MAKTVLLTGAAGFIGSHVADALLRQGDRVIGFDSFDAYYDPAIKRENVADVLRGARAMGLEDRLVLLEGDIRDPDALARCFTHEPDVVVHLAGLAGVRASIDDPGRYADVNVTGTIRLLEAMRHGGTRHIVLASTSSAYGASDETRFSEWMPADRPLSPYAATKRAAEHLVHSYHRAHGVSGTVLRFFTAYGPRNRPDMMAYKLLDTLEHDQEVTVFDGGQIHRDWTYVTDIADGVSRAAHLPFGFEVINLGRGEPTRLLDFIRLVERETEGTLRMQSAPRPHVDPPYTCADVSRARRLLGYAPRVSVQDGVRRLVAWYRAHRSGALLETADVA